MKRLVLMAIVVALSGGCAGDKGKELFDTAQLEEKQHNEAHARQLYEEIVTKYPKSPVAKQAEERLTALSRK